MNRGPPGRGRHGHAAEAGGFTLIEALAVVAVLSLAASTLALNLAAGSDSTRLRAAAAAWRDIDSMARLHARTGGPVMMQLDGGGTVIALHQADSGELLSEVVLPPRATGRVNGSAVGTIEFDSHGCSIDYQVVLDDGVRRLQWRVAGLSGQVIEEGQ